MYPPSLTRCYQAMIHRYGLQMPALSLSLWHNFGDVDLLANSRGSLRRAFDSGIAHFDMANNYGPPAGSAEADFGLILRGGIDGD